MSIRHCLLALFLSFFSVFAFAGKVVVFNPQAAVFNTDAAKKVQEGLKKNKEIAALVAQAESIKADMQAAQKKADKDGLTWGAAERADHAEKMKFMNADLQLIGQKAQAKQKEALDKLVKETQPKLETVIKKIMKDKKIDIVLDRQVSVLVEPSADITQDVIEALNALK